jgi:hypothetical protein
VLRDASVSCFEMLAASATQRIQALCISLAAPCGTREVQHMLLEVMCSMVHEDCTAIEA